MVDAVIPYRFISYFNLSATDFRRLTYSAPPRLIATGFRVQTDGVVHSAAHAWADFIYQDELFGGQRFQREKSKYGLSRLQNMPFGSVQGLSWRHVSETVVIQHDQLWLLVNFCPRKASVMRCARSLQSFEWASECSIGYLCCMFLMYDLEGDV